VSMNSSVCRLLSVYSLPQTWEDPTFVHPDAEGCKGDNDPVDIVEIGAKIIPTGVRIQKGDPLD